MKVAAQWTLATPQDWQFIDSSEWASLPFKPEPVGGEVIDDNPGWIYQICVQGMTFTGDHYVVLHDIPVGGCTVVCWNDDPDDYQPPDYYAHIVRFVSYEADPNFGGAYHGAHLQRREVYAGNRAMAKFEAWPWPKEAWNKLPKPSDNLIRHGIWVSDALSDAHVQARTPIGWRDWTEGVPADHLTTDGKVK